MALISLIAPSKFKWSRVELVGNWLHLSKMKFCHPVLDTFSPRKSDHISLHKQHMDKLTCMPADFQGHERTGMQEVIMPLDLGKPPPQDVLKTLSLGLEFENKLIELCGEAENSLTLTPFERNVKLKQSMTSPVDEGKLVGLGHVRRTFEEC